MYCIRLCATGDNALVKFMATYFSSLLAEECSFYSLQSLIEYFNNFIFSKIAISLPRKPFNQSTNKIVHTKYFR